MKKAYLKDLHSKLLGSVTDAADVLDYYATDGSIFKITPEAVVYPKNTADVRKTLEYLTERAHAGKHIGLIPRGQGTDQGGGAIGDGIQLVMPAHMNRILRLEKDYVVVQPGLNYRALQQTLHTHGRFLPPYPASIDYSTIGGAVANNAAGEKSYKYGSTRDFVKNLKVVLADGSLIETKRISARELARKKGQMGLEGDIYRGIDALILDHGEAIAKHKPATSKNASGYDLWDIKHSDGSVDLTQLFIGSQGTLGVITEITLKTLPWNPRTTLLVSYFNDLHKAGEAITKLTAAGASCLELADYYLLDYLRRNHPQEIEGMVPEPLPKIVLLAEFDDFSQVAQRVKSTRARRILNKYAASTKIATDPVEQEGLWRLRRSAAALMWLAGGPKKALPFIEDAVVPPAKLPQLLDKTYKLLEQHEVEIAVWGHAGDGNLHLQPLLDLSKKKDVDKLFDLAREFNELVLSLGGSLSGEHNDGLVRAPYLEQQFGSEVYDVFRQAKQVCDPNNILNPNHKVDVTEEYTRQFVRDDYSLAHLSDHMPFT
jgi:FAD/FMN-containing dehydrogenase